MAEDSHSEIEAPVSKTGQDGRFHRACSMAAACPVALKSARNLLLSVVTEVGSSPLLQDCPAIMIVAGRYWSSVLGCKSISVGTFVSGDINMDSKSPASRGG